MPTIDFDTAPATTAPVDGALLGELPAGPREIPVEQIHPHPHNPRRDVGDVAELAADIKQHGILQALLVVPDPGDPERYLAVIGHRRLAASKLAGRATVPAFVDPTLTLADQIERMLSENVQRADLTPAEEGFGYAELLDLGMTIAQAAKGTGRSESTVRRRLKIVELPEEAREKVHAGKVTLDDVARLPDPAAVTPKQYEKLVNALGSHNFGYALQEVETANRKKREWAELEVALADAGVEVVKQVPAGYKYAGYVYDRTSLARLDAGEGWVYKPTQRPYGELHRPLTAEEAASAAEVQEKQTVAEAEQRARLAACERLADVSGATRRAFLVDAIARKNPKAAPALVEFLSTVVVAETRNVYHYIKPGTLDATALVPSEYARTAGQWLGLDVDALAAEDASAAARAFVDAWAKTSPTGRLLALLASAVEPLDAQAWADKDHADVIIAWYQLLDELGYEISDVEQAALEGTLPAADTEDES